MKVLSFSIKPGIQKLGKVLIFHIFQFSTKSQIILDYCDCHQELFTLLPSCTVAKVDDHVYEGVLPKIRTGLGGWPKIIGL